MKRIIKKSIAVIMTCVLAAGAATLPTTAHVGDLHNGNNGYNNADIRIRVADSALSLNFVNLGTFTPLMSSNNQGWNGKSSKVKIVDVGKNVTGQNVVTVVGEHRALEVTTDGRMYYTLAYVRPIDINGTPREMDENWHSASIRMNINPNAWSGTNASKDEDFRRTIRHEVGHLFKLAHPHNNKYYSQHIYDGYPSAVMNQTSVTAPGAVSATITTHDTSCLTTRWGN